MDEQPTPLEALQAFVANEGTQKDAAIRLGISQQYLNDILHGRRDISAEVARKIGYRREVIYVQEQPGGYPTTGEIGRDDGR